VERGWLEEKTPAILDETPEPGRSDFPITHTNDP
jgi:hypothetical protein